MIQQVTTPRRIKNCKTPGPLFIPLPARYHHDFSYFMAYATFSLNIRASRFSGSVMMPSPVTIFTMG